MGDDVRSSDIEYSDTDQDALSKIGHRARASIVAQSVVDRLASKKKLKTLKDVGGAPSTTIRHRYWLTLFDQFAEDTLKINQRASNVPVPDDAIRFISQLPFHLQSRHASGQIAWTVIKNAEAQLNRALIFRHASWKLERHDALRMDATIKKLLDDGAITRDPVREVQWLTSQIIKHLVSVTFLDAIDNGTQSWDYTSSGMFALVLQAALASRAGDFMRSHHYTGKQYLHWKDITIIVEENDGSERFIGYGKYRLRMLIKLRFRKNCKNDSTKSINIELGELPGNNNNTVDPVLLCLAYALRVGAVSERTLAALLDTAARRPVKQILWVRPEDAVFYALTRSQHLDFSGPAGIEILRRFLTKAADLIGMINVPVSHDIRKGAASDLAHLKTGTADQTTRVRRALGHSVTAANKGLTDHYIGRSKGDAWAERITQSCAESEANPGKEAYQETFGVELAPTGFSFIQRKIATIDIDRWCETQKVDKADRAQRYAARNALRRDQRAQWASHQMNIANTPVQAAPEPQTPLVTMTNSLHDEADSAHCPNTVSALADSGQAIVTGSTFHSLPSTSSTMPSAKDSSSAPSNKDFIDIQTDDSCIDPGLVTISTQIAFELTDGSSNAAASPSARDVEALTSQCMTAMTSSYCSTYSKSAVEILYAETDRFVSFLSSVNLSSTCSDSISDNIGKGNSRDQPSRFTFHCEVDGCSKEFESRHRRDVHQITCKDTQRMNEVFTEGQADDNESMSLNTPTPAKPGRKRKQVDINQAGPDFPKQCPDRDVCKVDKTFATPHLMKNHRTLHHDKNWPQGVACAVPGCQAPRDHFYVSREAYRRHLSTTHHLNIEQARVYIAMVIPIAFKLPRGISKNYRATMCLFPDCCTINVFPVWMDYQGHLQRTHGLVDEQVLDYYPTATAFRAGLT